MGVPSDAVVTSPCCRSRDTVPLVVGSQFRVVAWPAVKVYPPLGILKGLALLEAATTAAKTATTRQTKARILIKVRVILLGGKGGLARSGI